MEYIKKTVKEITKHALTVIDQINADQVNKMIDIILKSDSIFVVGTGRSKLIGKAFAMRLMHLGFTVHVVGDVTTPAIDDNDCLIAVSGSGETNVVIIAAQTAKDVNATVIGVTTNTESTLSIYLDVIIKIKSKSKEPWEHPTSHVLKGNYDDLTPMGTLFEDTTHLFLDGLIAEFMSRLGKKEVDLQKRHTIIE